MCLNKRNKEKQILIEIGWIRFVEIIFAGVSMSGSNRGASVIYYGKGTTYNLAFLGALERAGYNSGGRATLSAEGLGQSSTPSEILFIPHL